MKPREITSLETLGQAINTEYRVVYCGTHWSLPCRAQYSILVRIAEYYRDREPIVQVDIEKNPDMAAELAIQSIPTILVFSRGKEIHRIVGLQSLENLLRALADFLPVQTSIPQDDEIKKGSFRKQDSDHARIGHYGKMH